MAGFSEQQAEPLPIGKAAKAPEDIAREASSFPASFAVQRGFSDASSILTDAGDLDAAATLLGFEPGTEALLEGQFSESTNGTAGMDGAANGRVLEHAGDYSFQGDKAAWQNGSSSETTQQDGDAHSRLHENGESGKGAQELQSVVPAQLLQKLLHLKASGSLQASLAEDAASVLSVTAIDGSTCSGGEGPAGDLALSEQLSEISQPASNGHHASPAAADGHALTSFSSAQGQDNLAKPAGPPAETLNYKIRDGTTASNGNASEVAVSAEGERGDVASHDGSATPPEGPLEAKGSGVSLSPESVLAQPFVPSSGSSVSEEPVRSEEKSPTAATASKPTTLNVNAAAFVPTFSAQPPQSPASGEPASNGFWQQHHLHQPLQFGSLPESLGHPSPPYSADGQQEWNVNGYAQTNGGHTGYPEQEWQNGWGEEYYDPNLVYGEEPQYYQQEDGTWVAYPAEGYYDQTEDASNWQTQYGNGASHDEYYNENHAPRSRKGGSGARKGRAGRRGGDGPGSWHSAAVDVLEQQFPLYSRDSLHEMLDLHEGSLALALDMLAQLEAEMDGQLPSDGQDAPELNEENFPSLGSAASTPSKSKSPAKHGFAAAVKSAASSGPKADKQGGETPRSPANGTANGKPARLSPASSEAASLPWRETGEAVTELYSSARAVAREHARARNTFFQEATKAYLAGNKALARELGAKGREQSELMKAAHVEASQAIYKHRNPISGGSRGPKGPRLVDLHGLHVTEAVAALEKEVTALRQHRPRNPRPLRLSVLVGTGHHTKGSRTPSRLPPAVEDWLRSERISFSRASPGLLEVSV